MSNRPTIVKPKVVRPSGLLQPKTRMLTAVGKVTGTCHSIAAIYMQNIMYCVKKMINFLFPVAYMVIILLQQNRHFVASYLVSMIDVRMSITEYNNPF